MQISFILVDPVVPENVGFCARGLKTMGFSELRIVGHSIHEEKGARNTAYGSHDLLEEVKLFESLRAATEDVELIVGTTAKDRVGRYDYHNPAELSTLLSEKSTNLKMAIVFGSETNGLSKDDIALCDLLSTIPLQTTYPSLNLAQAVMVYAYELAKASERETEKNLNESLTWAIKEEAQKLLDRLEYDRYPIKKQRIMDRLLLMGEGDSQLVMGLLKSLNSEKNS